jgi:radical SAM-linked protein
MDRWTRVRVVFGKRGRLRFLGQLDLGRTLERALRRSGLPVRFSEGFNPRVRLSFPCASPTSMASSCEIVEVQVLAPAGAREVRESLGRALPEELPVLAAEEVPDGERLRLLEARYAVRPREEGAAVPDSRAVEALLARDAVPVERRGRPADLRPFLRGILRTGEALEMRLAFREDGSTARPEDVVGALGGSPAAFLYERTGMLAALRRPDGATEERTYGA